MKNNYNPSTHIERFFEENPFIMREDRASIRDIFGHLIEVAKLPQSEFERLPQEKRYSTAQAKQSVAINTSLNDEARQKLARVFDVAYWQAQNPTAHGVMGGLSVSYKK
jgi:hypothetical protein